MAYGDGDGDDDDDGDGDGACYVSQPVSWQEARQSPASSGALRMPWMPPTAGFMLNMHSEMEAATR